MRALLLSAALLGCGKSDRASAKEMEQARRDRVVEVVVGDVNHDDVLDSIVVYAPTAADVAGQRVSTMDAYDGSTGATLWSTRLEGHLLERIIDHQRMAVVGSTIAIASGIIGANTDLEPVFYVHDLATGKPLWKRQFEGARINHSFALWPLDDTLLVLVHGSDRDTEQLHALDARTGASRWLANIPSLGLGLDAPRIVDGQIVLSSDNVEQGTVVIVDPKTGTLHTVACSGRIAPIATHDTLYVGLDEPEYVRALGRVDVHTGAVTRVHTLPLSPDAGGAVFRDVVLHVDRRTLVATRIGESQPAWQLEVGHADWGRHHHQPASPHASYFEAIPARYLPFVSVDDRRGTIVVVDLETGRAQWRSKTFDVSLAQSLYSGISVIGTHYYADLLTSGGSVLIDIDGTTGQFVGAYRVRIDNAVGAPNDEGNGTPYAWHFQYGMVVGHWNDASWVIDLQKKRLAMSHPAGRVVLEQPWDLVEETLGAVPRGLDLAP